MTDYEQFESFFRKMGIAWLRFDHKVSSRYPEEPKASYYCLSVSQAYFCFDRKRQYLGVVSDEMGHWEPRAK
jgi:hypothetical protein